MPFRKRHILYNPINEHLPDKTGSAGRNLGPPGIVNFLLRLNEFNGSRFSGNQKKNNCVFIKNK